MDAAKRYAMINTLSGVLPLYIVTEYPKSGGSWVSQMLAGYLELDFPRNRTPSIKSCVMHGHNLRTPLMNNVVCVYRDGRDVMTSAYFHRLFENEKNSPLMVAKTRREVGFTDYQDVKKNLPAFIEHQASIGRRSISPGKFTWGDFVDSWFDADVVSCRYEDVIANPFEEVGRVLQQLAGVQIDACRLAEVVARYSFSAQARRAPGEEDTRSFLRKGQPGDWREKFTREAAEVFNEHFGTHLQKLGYVSNDDWVGECPIQ